MRYRSAAPPTRMPRCSAVAPSRSIAITSARLRTSSVCPSTTAGRSSLQGPVRLRVTVHRERSMTQSESRDAPCARSQRPLRSARRPSATPGQRQLAQFGAAETVEHHQPADLPRHIEAVAGRRECRDRRRSADPDAGRSARARDRDGRAGALAAGSTRMTPESVVTATRSPAQVVVTRPFGTLSRRPSRAFAQDVAAFPAWRRPRSAGRRDREAAWFRGPPMP